jgi:glucose-1-phosphate adenylyltransferase
MDYGDMLRTHIDSQADVTIAALPVDRHAARSFGIMRIDDTGRVQGFLEKPKTDAEIDIVRMEPAWIDGRGIQSRGRDCLANMGIYLFRRTTLLDVLTKTNYRDFGREVFPAAVRSRRVMVHLFDGYWEDIGTIKAFYESNLSLASSATPFQFHVPDAPIYTRARFLPPTLMDGASVKGSLIAEGCHIGKGAHIENSIIGLRCVIGENVTIRDSIIMGADEFDTDERRVVDDRQLPPLGIGAGSVIEGAILDKNCRVGRNVRIVNSQRIENTPDADDCVIRDGIPVVVKNASLADGWKL